MLFLLALMQQRKHYSFSAITAVLAMLMLHRLQLLTWQIAGQRIRVVG